LFPGLHHQKQVLVSIHSANKDNTTDGHLIRKGSSLQKFEMAENFCSYMSDITERPSNNFFIIFIHGHLSNRPKLFKSFYRYCSHFCYAILIERTIVDENTLELRISDINKILTVEYEKSNGERRECLGRGLLHQKQVLGSIHKANKDNTTDGHLKRTLTSVRSIRIA
jgi:hypothetical protein